MVILIPVLMLSAKIQQKLKTFRVSVLQYGCIYTDHRTILRYQQAVKLIFFLPDAEKFAAINGLLEGNFRNYDESGFDEAWEAKIYPDHGWGGKGGEITDRLFLSKFVKARTGCNHSS